MTTLLGHLAKFSSFTKQSELLCTQGLAYLLQNADACAAFQTQLLAPAGVKLSGDLTWRAEVRLEHRGRPDLEACTADGKPVVMIEGKLSAALGGRQLRAYTDDLQRRGVGGILLVVVPRYRLDEAKVTVTSEFVASGDGRCRSSDMADAVLVAVMSWDEILAALGTTSSEHAAGDLAQFVDLYQILSGGIFPLHPVPVPWREMETPYTSLIDQATRRLTSAETINPMAWEGESTRVPEQDGVADGGDEPVHEQGAAPTDNAISDAYKRRYVCRRPVPVAKGSCFSIGLRDPFLGFTTPIWLRFHSATGMFATIRARLMASGFAGRLVAHRGHVWLPLDLPEGESDGEILVRHLVAQAERIIEIAYPA